MIAGEGGLLGMISRSVWLLMLLVWLPCASWGQGGVVSGAAPSMPSGFTPTWDTWADTWAATDALGRTLPMYAQVGPPRKDRTVGLFYFLWLGAYINGGPYDITRILAQHPDAMQHADDLLWGPLYAPHHWGEPLFGYYLTDDAWVLRKHAQMLADAGVDVIIFDVTNQITYPKYYKALLDVFAQVRQAGGRTPQVAFLCPFGDPRNVVQELYHDLYAPGLHSDLWFRWHGKPLLLADPGRLAESEGNTQQDTPAPLLPGHTLGQTFTTAKSFISVGGCFPTWATSHSAMTLTLYRQGVGGKEVARQRFTDVRDNAWLSMRFAQPLPPGSYYLEMAEAAGTIGWWSESKDIYASGQAVADRAATGGDRTLRIEVVSETETRLRDFFTFRKPQPDYFQGSTAPDMWSWLEVYPQHVFRNAQGEKEQMSVGVAQNAVGGQVGSLSEPGARGRNWHQGANDTRPHAVNEGLNFAEQFARALHEDPRFIFITGWNEWIAGRFGEFAGVRAPVLFVDEFNEERSRDIEPMRGGHGDDYFYQMVAFIRRYKGVRKPPAASARKTIHLDGDFAAWKAVQPEYRDDIGDTAWRDHPGWNNVTRYTNKTGRNDFVALKVARDADYVYFYARTHAPISPHTDPHWMLLFINIRGNDTRGNAHAGWEGYHYVVNRRVLDDTTTLLETSAGGWNWKVRAKVRYRVRGNELELAIRRDDLGLRPGQPLHLQFKWADNMQRDGDVMEFTVSGDAAPNGRFNYVYEAR
jgi:hypothetical protein